MPPGPGVDESAGLVLVVDDDPDIREALSDLLGDSGFEVTCSRNGDAALAWLCSHEPPAVVLVDVLMPGMNGWELIGQMRRRDKLSGVPVIALTGLGPQWVCPVPERLVVRKPIDPARLVELVRSVVAESAR